MNSTEFNNLIILNYILINYIIIKKGKKLNNEIERKKLKNKKKV
jgi:hypothetical protein